MMHKMQQRVKEYNNKFKSAETFWDMFRKEFHKEETKDCQTKQSNECNYATGPIDTRQLLQLKELEIEEKKGKIKQLKEEQSYMSRSRDFAVEKYKQLKEENQKLINRNTKTTKTRKQGQVFDDFTLGQFLGTDTHYCKGHIFGGLSFEGNLSKQDNILCLLSDKESKDKKIKTVCTKNKYGFRELEKGIISLSFDAQ